MSARIEWNPNAERDIKREVVGNLTPRFKSALAAVTCPDHGEHPTLDPKSEEWQVDLKAEDVRPRVELH